MSVMMISPEVYSKVLNQAKNYQYHKQVDINYCYTFGKLSETNLDLIVKTWCDLNEETYEKKYLEIPARTKQSEFIDYGFGLGHLSAYQMVKYLESIRHQIEPKTINRPLNETEQIAMSILNDVISEISHQIISSQPQYEEAAWS